MIKIFAGPTMFDLYDKIDSTILKDFEFHPPIKRFDLKHLLQSQQQPGTIVIVDGVFFPNPAVGHRELRDALSAGWTIFGLSSMGAIRAFEMKDFGLKGYGYVYNRFFIEEDFRDDEMALIYSNKHPYYPLSEPLINIRYFFERCLDKGLVSGHIAENIIIELSNMWFGFRTLDFLYELLSKYDPSNVAIIGELSKFKEYRIKSIDLVNFFHEKPWLK